MLTNAKAGAIAKGLIAQWSKPPEKGYFSPGYVSTPDAARLMRALLEANFPGVRFYVRSRSYSGGSAIDVYYDGVEVDAHGSPVREECWEHGDGHYYGRTHAVLKPGAPPEHEVKRLLDNFGGADFDGMIDMQFSHGSYLFPDGRVLYGGTSGTAGSRGTVDKSDVEKPAGAVPMRFHGWVSVEASLPYDVWLKQKKGAA